MNREILDHYKEYGYAVIPNALSQQDLDYLNQLVDEDKILNKEDWPEFAGASGNGQIILKYPELDRFVRHPVTFPIVEEILCGEPRFAQFDFRDVTPLNSELSGMQYHRDISFFAESGGKTWDPDNPYISTFTCLIYYLTPVRECCPCFSIIPKSHEYTTLEEAKEALGDNFHEIPITGEAGTAVLYNITTYHTRIAGKPDCVHGRRTMHNYHSRESLPPLTNFVLIPEELAMSNNSETARFYSKWTPKQINYANKHYKSKLPTYYHPIPEDDKNRILKG